MENRGTRQFEDQLLIRAQAYQLPQEDGPNPQNIQEGIQIGEIADFGRTEGGGTDGEPGGEASDRGILDLICYNLSKASIIPSLCRNLSIDCVRLFTRVPYSR